MSKEILMKRKILEPGEELTVEAVRAALRQLSVEQVLGSIEESETNQTNQTKIQKGVLEMSIRSEILKLDQSIKESEGTINKSERISKELALDFLYKYADAEREAHPELSKEKCLAKAMTECPSLGGLAIGHSMEAVRGIY